METLTLYLLRWLQRQCAHPGYAVKADILEGGVKDGGVQWCEICGAHRLTCRGAHGAWRDPRPDWYTAKERRQLAKDMRAAIEAEKRQVGSYR